MSCRSCKDKKWRISLKLSDSQKTDPTFKRKILHFLEAVLLDRPSEQIKQIVEFAGMCDESLIAESNREEITKLSSRCFEHNIPIKVTNTSPWK